MLKYHWNSIKEKLVRVNKPFCSGVILEGGIKIRTPKKPNSSNKQTCQILLSNKKKINAYISGEGHSLGSYSSVMIQGQGPQDLPGVNAQVRRGVLDDKGVTKLRRNGRSLYGIKRNQSPPPPRIKRKK